MPGCVTVAGRPLKEIFKNSLTAPGADGCWKKDCKRLTTY